MFQALLNRELGALNTFLLITSSFSMAMAVGAMHRGQRDRVKQFLPVTILLGCAFLVVKGIEYSQKFAHHYSPSTDLFFSFYFVMTGIHAFHVLVGVIILIVIFLKVSGNSRTVDGVVVENVGLYWHLVDVIWIFLFPLLYLT